MASPLTLRYDKAREACALFHMEDWAVFCLEGTDVRDYLHRISTADMKGVQPGQALQTLFLQGDGRLVADSIACCISEHAWYLVCPATCHQALDAQLDRFLFTEDVKVSDLSSQFYVGQFLGPKSDLFLEHLRAKCLDAGSGALAVVATIAPQAVRGFVLVPEAAFAEAKTCMYGWLDANGGVIGDLDLYNTFRIETGSPQFGKELTEKTIPLEAGQKPAISFTKGCFPGQEIVARINNLGHPANVLVGFTLPETTDVLEGRELQADGKTIGRITSLCYSPLLRSPLGLGYVKWAQREPGTVVKVSGDEGYSATIVKLPVPGAVGNSD